MLIAEPVEIPEDGRQTAVVEGQAREEIIKKSLGITAAEYWREVEGKYSELMKEKEEESPDELLKEAFQSIENKYKT